jgi:UDP-N-acetyl-D-mannosaminuronic acid dehydrogenase
MIAPYLEKNNLIIIKSTCPVNTTTSMVKLLNMLRPDLKNKIHVAYCPERVIPGRTIYEITHNNRIIGGIDEISADVASIFYGLFSCGELFKTNAKTAEMCKLVENSFRDINIAFANELSILCDKFDINVWELITLANKHPRVNILQPSCGVGGHCIAIDPWFLISAQPNESKVIRAAREGNLYKAEWVINKVKMKIAKFKMEYHTEPIVACMGLTFKPDIDDLRESPALYIAKELAKTNNILFVEPNISTLSNTKLTSFTKAITTANILIFLVAHSQFKNLNISKDKKILDYCGVCSIT